MQQFRLTDNFLEEYKNKSPDWGALGEFVFLRSYSRFIESENRNERWWETVRRVVEGTFNIQKDHCAKLRLPWNNQKSQRSAKIMFDKIFNFKFTPSGRGLWMMGTEFVREKGAAALASCAYVTSEDIETRGSFAFCWAMDASMLGVGIGFDTKGAGKIIIKEPKNNHGLTYQIPDTREGWVESLELLLDAFFYGKKIPEFDYSIIRPYGTPIKGFGGTSSGYGPLKEMHESIKKLLLDRIDEFLSSTDIVDIMNLIARCVVSGNCRRSAMIAFGDPKDVDYVTMKDCNLHPKELESHRWSSNNSIFAEIGKTDYHKMTESIIVNGEPGIVWIENARKYGRLKDGETWADKNVGGTNPSLRRGTKVLTTNGIYPIEDLEGKVFKIKNINGGISKAKCFLSGKKKKLWRVKFEGGHEYYCTEEHKWPILQEDRTYKKTITSNISNGSYIPLIPKQDKLFDGVKGSYNEGFLFGYNLGDGWITKRKDNGKYQIGFILNEEDYNSDIKNILLNQLKEWGYEGKFNKHGKASINDYEVNTQRESISSEFIKRGFINKKYGLPKFVFEEASEEFRKALIDGLFSSNGCISSGNIIFTSSQKKLAEDVSSLLGFYGIKNNITKKIVGSNFPNGKDYGKEYISYRVIVSESKSKLHFAKLFRLSNKIKQSLLEEIRDSSRHWFSKSNCIKVISIEETQLKEDVWDITVYDDTHCFQLSQCITGNCGEILLESVELCNLVESFPSRHESYEEYQETLKYAYLYGKTVTLLPTHWPETNQVIMKNRRIGVSQSGIIDAFGRHGRREILNWCDSGYKYLRELDEIYSNWLCVPKSIKISAVKPSGSVSLLPGVSPGIHYPHSEYYIRRVRIASDSPLISPLKKAGYHIEDNAYGSEDTKKRTLVISFPIHEENFIKKKEDVSIWEQVKNVTDYQTYWSDNAISCTVHFKKEEAKDVPRVLEAFEDQLKSISFLPLLEHGYKQAPLEAITEKEYNDMIKKLKIPDFSNITTIPEGEMFCTNDSCEIKIQPL